MIKLLNGDCFELLKDIEDNSIDCIITDPPYKMQWGTKGATELGKRMNKRREELNDDNLLDFGEREIKQCASEFKRVLKKINLFVFCSKDQIRYWINEFDINPYILFWCKTNPTPLFNNTLRHDVEYILYFRENGVPLYTTYDNSSRYDITSINQKDKEEFGHPTCKPIQILERYIDFATKEGDIVLDPFMGTGTTAVCCKHLNRHYIGFEISDKYAEICKQRIIEETAKDGLW